MDAFRLEKFIIKKRTDAYLLKTENLNYIAQGRSVLFSAVSVIALGRSVIIVEDFAVQKSFGSISAKGFEFRRKRIKNFLSYIFVLACSSTHHQFVYTWVHLQLEIRNRHLPTSIKSEDNRTRSSTHPRRTPSPDYNFVFVMFSVPERTMDIFRLLLYYKYELPERQRDQFV